MRARLRERLLHIDESDFSSTVRGFDGGHATVRADLDGIMDAFARGYNTALASRSQRQLAAKLAASFDDHHVGFAFEGAGMCFAVLDLLSPWSKSRLRRFTRGAGASHDYIASVGAGFAIARLPGAARLLPWYLRRLEPGLAWCVIDGYGFHEGFFHHRRYFEAAAPYPAGLSPRARRLFDAGLGRSLWWAEGASPGRIQSALAPFDDRRQAEMWCGIGTACAYAGGVHESVLAELRRLAGPLEADLMSGVPFAARMRQRAGNASTETELACAVLLGLSADECADWLLGHLEEETLNLGRIEPFTSATVYDRVRKRLKEDLASRRAPAAVASS